MSRLTRNKVVMNKFTVIVSGKLSLIQFSKKVIHIVEYYRYANVTCLCMHTRRREVKNVMYLGVA